MDRPRSPALAAMLAAALGAAALSWPAGCGVRPQAPYAGIRVDPSAMVNPFAAVAMEIHPLTRVDRDAQARLWIVCHIELRDVWGHPVKGIGDLEIQLYRPIGGRLSGVGIQELTWDINLTDMERNASLYDAATRTYRLPLRDAPAWLAEAPEAPGGRGLLRAQLSTVGPQGEPLSLTHEFVLQ
jgi:hypothetical protein